MRTNRKPRQLALAASIVATIAAAIILGVTPASAQTPLSVLCTSPDIAVALTSGTISPQQVNCYSFPSGTAAKSFTGIPAGVNVTSYFPLSATQTLLTIDTTATLPAFGGGAVIITPHDVGAYNPTGKFFSLYFAGSANSIPDGTRIDAIGMDGEGGLLLSFDVTITVPQFGGGTLTVKPADLVSFNPAGYTLVFNSAARGIPDGMNLDGATMLPNADLLMAFDESGTIASIDFAPTDVLEFDPGSNAWALSFSGKSTDEWPDGSSVQGVWAAAVSPTPSATPTATKTASSTPTPTATPTATPTKTATPTATATGSATPTTTATSTVTPTPVPVTLKVKPKSLKFPDIAHGTHSKSKVVKVSNPKGKKKHPGFPVLIEMISDPGVFTQTNDCPASLAPGASCSISVTFTPSAAMKQTGTLTITDNANKGMQQVPLTGTGK